MSGMFTGITTGARKGMFSDLEMMPPPAMVDPDTFVMMSPEEMAELPGGYTPTEELPKAGGFVQRAIKDDIPAILESVKLVVTNQSPYAEDKDLIKNTLPVLKWGLTYMASLGGRLGGKGLREELLKEASEYGSFGEAVLPATGDMGVLALDFGLLYPKLFQAAGLGANAIKANKYVRAGAAVLKRMGGIDKVAKANPRHYKNIVRTMEAVSKGVAVGTTVSVAEIAGKDMTRGDMLAKLGKDAVIMGGVAGIFQAVSNVDTSRYVNKLRKALLSASNTRFDTRLKSISGMGKSASQGAAYKSLDSLKRIELQNIDDIVSAVEAELLGLKSGKLYQSGQEMVMKPEQAAERFIKYGHMRTGVPKGPKALQKGLAGKAPFIETPTTRAGEAVETAKGVLEKAAHPIRTVKRAARAAAPKRSIEDFGGTRGEIIETTTGKIEAIQKRGGAKAISEIAAVATEGRRQIDAIEKQQQEEQAKVDQQAQEQENAAIVVELVGEEQTLPEKLERMEFLLDEVGKPENVKHQEQYAEAMKQLDEQITGMEKATKTDDIKQLRKIAYDMGVKIPRDGTVDEIKAAIAQARPQEPSQEVAPEPEPTQEPQTAPEPIVLPQEVTGAQRAAEGGEAPAEEPSEEPEQPEPALQSQLDALKPIAARFAELTKGKRIYTTEEIPNWKQATQVGVRAVADKDFSSEEVAELRKMQGQIEAIQEQGPARLFDPVEQTLVLPSKPKKRADETVIKAEDVFEPPAAEGGEAPKAEKPKPEEPETEPQKEAAEIEEKIPEATVEPKPGPPKTLESMKEEAKKEPDRLIVKPTEKTARVITPLKGRKKTVQSQEDKDKLITFTDYGHGLGVKGKEVWAIPIQRSLMELANAGAARKAAATLHDESGIDFTGTFEEISEQWKKYAAAKGLPRGDETAIKRYLTGKGADLATKDYLDQFDAPYMAKWSHDLQTLKSEAGAIQRTLKQFAKAVPEFKANPTFTVEKHDGNLMLVFRDNYRFRYFPHVFGLDEANLKEGETIRFDLESFGIKEELTTKEIKDAQQFLGEPKVLGKQIPLTAKEKAIQERRKRAIEWAKDYLESEGADSLSKTARDSLSWGIDGTEKDIYVADDLIKMFEKAGAPKFKAEKKPKPAEPAKKKREPGGSPGSAAGFPATALRTGYGTIGERPPAPPRIRSKEVEEALRGRDWTVLDELLKMVSPAHRKLARPGARLIRKNLGKMAQTSVVAHEALHKAHRAFTFMPRARGYEFIDRMEKGEKQPTAALQDVADKMRHYLNQRRDAVRALGKGKLENFYVNYFPHIWKDPKKATGIINRIMGRKPLEGPKSFLKKRTIMTVKEGMDLGLEPVSENPVDLVLLKLFEMDRYLMTQYLIRDLKAASQIRFVYSLGRGPEGYAKIEDRAFTVYLPPEISIKEAYDEIMVTEMMAIARSVGVNPQRVMKIRGKAWGKAMWPKGAGAVGPWEIKTKFAGPESVLAHEIGHVIGVKYGLFNLLRRKFEGETKVISRGKNKGKEKFVPSKSAVAFRSTIDKQWRELADARFKGHNVGPGYRKYVREAREKEAVMLEALLHAPDEFKRVAPDLYEGFTAFLNEHAELRPLLDLKSSLVLGVSEGKVKIPGFTVLGHWYAPEPVAKLLNNYLSPGLRNSNNRLIGSGYNMSRMAGNILNQAQLALSMFHALNVTSDMMASTFGQGLRSMMTSGQRIRGVGQALSTPVAPIARLWDGLRLRKAYKKQIDTITDPKLRELVQAVVLADGRDRMDPFYYNQAIKALSKTMGDLLHGRLSQKVTGVAKLPFQIFGSALELAAKPLMEWYVPTGKLGLFAMMARHEMKRAENGEITPAQLHERLLSSWDSVDNRMGQLVYDNLFWNKVFKDVSMLAVRSVGWNLGSWREFGGIPVDLLDTKGRLERGDKLLSQKIAYGIGAVVVYGILGASIGYLLTGKRPEEFRDYFFPKTGEKNPDGSDERISLPTYVKDWFAYGTQPIQTLKNKLHPLWGMLTDLASNKDFFGTEIRHPKDPISEQLMDVAEYIGENFLSISVQNFKKMQKASDDWKKNALVSITGITSAPSYITRSPAQRKATNFIISRIPDTSRTKEEFETNQYRKKIKNDLRAGREIDEAEVAERLGADGLRAVKTAAGKTSFEELFGRLSLDEAAQVHAITSPDEARQVQEILKTKLANAKTSADAETLTMLTPWLKTLSVDELWDIVEDSQYKEKGERDDGTRYRKGDPKKGMEKKHAFLTKLAEAK